MGPIVAGFDIYAILLVQLCDLVAPLVALVRRAKCVYASSLGCLSTYVYQV